MNSRLKFLLCIATLTVTLLAGCVGGRQQLDITYYSLTVPAVSQPAAAPKFGTLLVRDFYINPNYEDKNFNYRTGDLIYETDFYNQFKLSPRVQFTSLTRDVLRNSGLFQTVIMPEGAQVADCVLHADVAEFYADFRDPQRPCATLIVNFSLSGVPKKGLERPVLFAKSYAENVAISRRTADEVARAWNAALGNMMNRLVADLSEVVPPPTDTAGGETR